MIDTLDFKTFFPTGFCEFKNIRFVRTDFKASYQTFLSEPISVSFYC